MYLPIYIFILIELVFVAIGDIKTNKIPNFWSILNLVTFPILLFLAPNAYTIVGDTFLYPMAFLGIGFGLFLLRIMGAGDVKFLSTFFLIIPNEIKESVFTMLLISTVIIGGFVFITNFIRNYESIVGSLKQKDVQRVKSFFGTKFSYAPVILMSWLWVGWNIRFQFIF